VVIASSVDRGTIRICGVELGEQRRLSPLRSSAYFFLDDSVRPDHRWYCPDVPRSPVLPLAAAVTAVALGASPALASPLSSGKHDEAKAVAFPLLAVKGQASANVAIECPAGDEDTATAERRRRLDQRTRVQAPQVGDEPLDD
jgi:hypothetical protein